MAHFLLSTEGLCGDNFESLGGRYLNSRKLHDSPRTVQRRLTSMRAYGRYAKLGHVLADYVAPMGPPPRPHPIPEGMAGVYSMLEHTNDDYERVTVAMCGLAGARISEVLSLTYADVHLKERVVILGGKHNRWREVPLSQKAMQYTIPAVVAAHSRDDGLLVPRSDRWARNLIKLLAGLSDLDEETASHYLRATFATWLYAKTKDLRLVQEALGHARVTTTEIYTGINFQALRGAVEHNEGTS